MKRQHVTIFLTGFSSCLVVLHAAAAAEISTTDGRTYRNATVLRSDPDGLLISYEPQQRGVGMAKLHFRNLPDEIRSRYSYDADKASAFEKEQAQATHQWRAQLAATDGTTARYRAFAEINRALAGDTVTSYTVSLGADGRITAQGVTGSTQPYACFSWLNSGLWQQPQSSQLPQPTFAPQSR